MKEQLKIQLAQIEHEQQAAEQRLKPQTVETIDELERKLQDALTELQQQREELKRKGGTGPS